MFIALVDVSSRDERQEFLYKQDPASVKLQYDADVYTMITPTNVSHLWAQRNDLKYNNLTK